MLESARTLGHYCESQPDKLINTVDEKNSRVLGNCPERPKLNTVFGT